MTIITNDRFKLRGGLAADLADVNEVPLRREMIVELDNLFTTGEFKAKIGDGTTHYNDLPYLQTGGSGGGSYIAGVGIDISGNVIASTVGAIALAGTAANYAGLTTIAAGLGTADDGKAWLNLSDNLVYVWNGSEFPAQGDGLNISISEFSPIQLFRNSVDGAWFDPSDLSTMFQDAAGTTPVTATGQSVALIRDKSGNGHHALQATSANRPTYQVDSSGLPYLAFSGSQYLDCGDGFNAGTFMCCIGWRASNANQRLIDCRGAGTLGSVKGWYVKASNPSGADGFAVDSGDAYIASSHSTTNGSNHVGYFHFTVSTELRYQIDSNNLTIVTGGPLGSVESTKTSRIGAASNDATQGLNGRLYGVVVAKRPPAGNEITSLRLWMSNKTGVAI